MIRYRVSRRWTRISSLNPAGTSTPSCGSAAEGSPANAGSLQASIVRACSLGGIECAHGIPCHSASAHIVRHRVIVLNCDHATAAAAIGPQCS